MKAHVAIESSRYVKAKTVCLGNPRVSGSTASIYRFRAWTFARPPQVDRQIANILRHFEYGPGGMAPVAVHESTRSRIGWPEHFEYRIGGQSADYCAKAFATPEILVP